MTTTEQSTFTIHRRARFRRIGFSVIASLIARGLSLVITIVTTPLTLKYLGPERYAMWVTLSSITALLAFADLGIGNGLINSIAAANGKDDREAAHKSLSNAFLMLTALALLIGSVLIAIYPLVPWDKIYNVSSALAKSEAGPVTAVFVVCFLINMPLGIVQKALMGYQEVYIDNAWSMVARIGSLIGIFLAVRLDAGLIWLVIALVGVPILTTALEWVQLFWFRRPWLRPSLRQIDPKIIWFLMRLGWMFFALQIAGSLAYNIDNLVIAQVISPEAVTNYSIPSQLFKLSTVVISLVSLPLWPAYGEAIARHDLNWVKKTFKLSLLVNFASSALLSLVLVIGGKPIIHLWVGQIITPDPTLMIALAGWTIIYNVSSALSMLFNAASVIRFQVIWATVMALVNLGLSIILTHQFGAIGVVLGSIISYLICIFPVYFWKVPRLFAELEAQQTPSVAASVEQA
ncbi:MAG: oligosaccharide flippase family protein [Chloroflexi bacterium]|nr:oligosaccharide flippase family protein [Chloroflexota bacterium]